jgi:hypothetical protein
MPSGVLKSNLAFQLIRWIKSNRLAVAAVNLLQNRDGPHGPGSEPRLITTPPSNP